MCLCSRSRVKFFWHNFSCFQGARRKTPKDIKTPATVADYKTTLLLDQHVLVCGHYDPDEGHKQKHTGLNLVLYSTD